MRFVAHRLAMSVLQSLLRSGLQRNRSSIATLQLGIPNANLDLVAMIVDGTPLSMRRQIRRIDSGQRLALQYGSRVKMNVVPVTMGALAPTNDTLTSST